MRVIRLAERTDAALMRVGGWGRGAIVALALIACAGAAVFNVPRPVIDYSRYPLLHRIPQPAAFGTDSIADMFEARVVRNDVGDMYTKRFTEQTPLERATWSKQASSPYPPSMLLSLAALSAAGDALGIGLYGMVLALAAAFLALSLAYCLATRWYVFPLVCINAPYIASRFVFVQDGSYLVMLVVVMAALFLARRGSNLAHALMAIAICMKLSPLYYLENVPRMKRRWALLVVGIVVIGLVLPILVWDGYLSIYTFQTGRKGNYWLNTAGTLLLVVPFSLLLSLVESRLHFDMEDRVGWGLVPFALFLAVTMNAARHLFMVLLVPDKRGARTLAGSLGMAAHLAFPRLVPSGAVVYITAGLLLLVLLSYLSLAGGMKVFHARTIRDS